MRGRYVAPYDGESGFEAVLKIVSQMPCSSRDDGDREYGEVSYVARPVLLKCTLFQFCGGRKRNQLMIMDAKDTATLLLRFGNHVYLESAGSLERQESTFVPNGCRQ